MDKKHLDIYTDIIRCEKCPRLSAYIKDVAEKKVKRFREQAYWGKPVPGLGDPKAKVLIIGLAPAAHGANRTGRMFTGDDSGNWLMKALYETGLANQPYSTDKNDGLKLHKVFITSTIRCAPPKNKPLKSEIDNCRQYLEREMKLLEGVKVVITLGQIAFINFLKTCNQKGLAFGHFRTYTLSNNIKLISSFHPSKQNTQTGRLKWEEWLKVFKVAKTLMDG